VDAVAALLHAAVQGELAGGDVKQQGEELLLGNVAQVRAAILENLADAELLGESLEGRDEVGVVAVVPLLLLEGFAWPLVLPVAQRLGIAQIDSAIFLFLNAEVVITNALGGVAGEVHGKLDGRDIR